MWTGTPLTSRLVYRSATLRAFSNAATSQRLISRPNYGLNGKPMRSLYARPSSLKLTPFISTFTSSSILHANDAPATTSVSKSVDSDNVTVKEQRRKDWIIVKRLMSHVWPKDDWGTRGRVVLGFGLLITGKVWRAARKSERD